MFVLVLVLVVCGCVIVVVVVVVVVWLYWEVFWYWSIIFFIFLLFMENIPHNTHINIQQPESVRQDRQLQKIWSNAFMNYLDFDYHSCPDLSDDLVIHVRNGDVYTSFPQVF